MNVKNIVHIVSDTVDSKMSVFSYNNCPQHT